MYSDVTNSRPAAQANYSDDLFGDLGPVDDGPSLFDAAPPVVAVAPSPGDSVTVLTAQAEPGQTQPILAKRWRAGVASPDDYDNAKIYTIETVKVANLERLHALLTNLARKEHKAVVRGAPVRDFGDSKVRRLLHEKEDSPATLKAQPRRWLALDLDSVPVPDDIADPFADPVQTFRAVIVETLPPEFWNAGFVWQWSASAGFKQGIRARLWFWCDRPVADDEAKAWLSGAPVDPALFRPVQPIYTAAPVLGRGVADPIGGARLGIVPGGVVAVPELAERMESIARTERRLDSVGSAGGGFNAYVAAIGDGEGQAGFHPPTMRAIGAWFTAKGPDADPAELQAILEDAIRAAPCDPKKHPSAEIKKRLRQLPANIAYVQMARKREWEERVPEALEGPEWSEIEAAEAERKRDKEAAEAPPPPPPPPTMAELVARAAAMGSETAPEDIRDLLTAAATMRPKEIELMALFRAVKSATKYGMGELRADFRAIMKDNREAVDIAHTVAEEVVKMSYDGRLVRADDRSFWRFTGTHWMRVTDDVVLGRCIARARAHDLGDSDLRRVADNALRLLAGMQARDGDVLGLLREPPPVINCLNGELWLSTDGTAELRPHRPESYLKHCLPVAYDPAATCPRYDRALLEVFGAATDPADMARHWHEFTGYVAQPRRDIASWWLLMGGGANGKTMLASILEALLSPEAVLSTNIARAATDRFLIGAMASKLMIKDDDVNSNTKLPDKFLKEFGEGKATTGELKFKSHFSFVSVAVPVLLANNWPKTDDVSNGNRRRTRVVPFARQFEEAEQDLTLGKYIIANELAGVLNRSLEGLQRLFARGRFDDPADCRVAKDRFFRSANTVAGFVGARCSVEAGKKVVGNDLWLAYQTWASAEGLRAVPSRQGFYDALEALGYQAHKTKEGMKIVGLVLAKAGKDPKNTDEPEPAADEFESI